MIKKIDESDYYTVNQFVSQDYTIDIGLDRGMALDNELEKKDGYKDLCKKFKKIMAESQQ